MALTINGKRNRLNKKDFLCFADNIGVDANYAKTRVEELVDLQDKLTDMVNKSTLTLQLSEQFTEIIAKRLGHLGAGGVK